MSELVSCADYGVEKKPVYLNVERCEHWSPYSTVYNIFPKPIDKEGAHQFAPSIIIMQYGRILRSVTLVVRWISSRSRSRGSENEGRQERKCLNTDYGAYFSQP